MGAGVNLCNWAGVNHCHSIRLPVGHGARERGTSSVPALLFTSGCFQFAPYEGVRPGVTGTQSNRVDVHQVTPGREGERKSTARWTTTITGS